MPQVFFFNFSDIITSFSKIVEQIYRLFYIIYLLPAKVTLFKHKCYFVSYLLLHSLIISMRERESCLGGVSN